MPNAKVLSEKQAIVAALTDKLQNAAAGVIVDYKGITVAEDTELRAECRKNNIESGSGVPNKEKVATISKAYIQKIAEKDGAAAE